jgi:alkylation response protein AidB-like acyl-CoA dehydrogenase
LAEKVKMTDLDLSPEVIELKQLTRELSRDRLAYRAKDAEAAHEPVPDIIRSLDELGILSPLDPIVAKALNPVALVVIAEELALGDPGVAYEAIVGAHAALAINRLGNEEHLRMINGATSDGLPLGSLWCYEGFGRGPNEYATTIERTGDDLALDGHKIAVVRPGTADFAVVIGRGSQGSTAVLLGKNETPQVDITRDDRIVGKLGMNAAHTGNIKMTDVRVPAGSILDGTGAELAVDRLVASARLSVASVAVGTGVAAVGYAAEYAIERRAFGKPISEYQGVSFPLAEADIQLRTAREAIIDLASRLEQFKDANELAWQTGWVVAAAAKAALRATVTSVNTLGGHGFLTDHPVERWYRAAGTLAAIDNDPVLFS